MGKILIVDDELPIREVLSAGLRDEGHEVFVAHNGETGLKAMKEKSPDIVFLDIWMPGSFDGIEVLTLARQELPRIEFVMISGHGTIETAVRATKLGAWDFIEKPLSMDKISIVISNIISYQQEKKEKETLLNRLRKSIAIIGETLKIVDLKKEVAKVALTDHCVLIRGGKGTGKELTAQNLHYMSARVTKPFVELICSNLADDLIELELFGYEKGSIPGAERTHRGKIELAAGGTFFLNDVGDLSLRAQERLLRLLREKTFFRKGSDHSIELDVRLVAASSKDLEKEIAEGRFLPELFEHLKDVALFVPPLRARSEDVPALVSHFSDQVAKESRFNRKEFSNHALQAMINYGWPGNVRELRNFIERVYILTPGEFVDVHDLRFAGLPIPEESSGKDVSGADLANFREARAQFEKQYLTTKLQENDGNISRTAEVIGLERSYLHRKIKIFGIDVRSES